MTRRTIVDTGPLVTFCDRRDSRHSWVVSVFRTVSGPLLTCEAVMAEALYLTRHRTDMQDALLSMVVGGAISIPFQLEAEIGAVRGLRHRYANVPMSLADACLVRMAELHPEASVCTLDSDFTIYRRHGRDPIPLLKPD